MSVNITSNAQDGTTVATAEKQADNTLNITQDTNTTPVAQDAPQSNLPADRYTASTINYFGSSYSGADVKVYVNIYNDKTDVNQVISKLEIERDEATAIADASRQLSTNMSSVLFSIRTELTMNDKRVTFLQNIGLLDRTDEAGIKAALFMQQNFLNPLLSVTSTNEVTSLQNRALATSSTFTGRKEELANEIRSLKNVTTDGVANGGLFFLGTLQTLSLQSHREKFGVRALGYSYTKGYTRGPRTIAGSMIFTVFHEHTFAAVMRRMARVEQDPEISSLLPDQMAPLDLTVIFANEYGQQSEFRMYGVEFVNDSVTYSIEDLLTENVMQFVARDVDPLAAKSRIQLDRASRNIENNIDTEVTASNLFRQNNNYQSYLDRLHVRRRLLNR